MPARRAGLLALAFVPGSSLSFRYPDFCPWTGLSTADGGTNPANARVVNQGTKLRLVQANEAAKGIDSHSGEQNALYFDGGPGARVDLAAPFSTTWSLAADKDGGGGAGYALLLAAPADDFALGAIGAGVGYAGIPQALAVEFDFYADASTHDPDGNHVAVHASGAPPLAVSADEARAPGPGVVCSSADAAFAAERPWIAGVGAGVPPLGGKLYSATVSWVPRAPRVSGTLNISFEGAGVVLSCAVDLAAALGLGGAATEVAIGFVAANYAADDDEKGSGNISLHDWALDTGAGGAGACFPGFDAASDPPCRPLPPPAGACAAQSGAGCAQCVTLAQVCGCDYCADGTCADGGGCAAGAAARAYDTCLALPPASATPAPAPAAAAAAARGLAPGAAAAVGLGVAAALGAAALAALGAAGKGPLAALGAPGPNLAALLAAPPTRGAETTRLLAHGDRARSAVGRAMGAPP